MQEDGSGAESIKENIESLKKELGRNNIDAAVFQETFFKADVLYNGRRMEVLAEQGTGDSDDGMYPYIEGTPPANPDEIAITSVVAEETGAGIGDYVEASIGSITEKYIITAVFQSMQNMGSGIRIYHNKDTGDILPAGVFGIQVRYNDNPDSSLLKGRKERLNSFLQMIMFILLADI